MQLCLARYQGGPLSVHNWLANNGPDRITLT